MPHARDHGPGASEPYPIALERMNLFQAPEGRAAVADLALLRGSRGLDVGCGVGLYALWLAESVGPAGSVVGIEPSAERVAAAQSLVGHRLEPGRLELRVGDGTAIDGPDESFDWLWCGDVLHHIKETAIALEEFVRVVRRGGAIVVKESQVMPAVFLPGHPELERRIQVAEMERTREEAGGQTFVERRQRTRESMREAGLVDVTMRTYVLQRQAPLDETARAYVQDVVFDRNWGDRIRPLLAPEDWLSRSAFCEAGAPGCVLKRPDYYCLYSFTVWRATRPG
jgi:SAM-dependent methyltransferase